jgi:hypothetical protein
MRPFFTERARQLLRNMNNRNLTELATVWYMKEMPRGVNTATYPTVRTVDAEAVPCRLAPLDLRVPFEQLVAQQYGVDAKWVVIFEAGTRIEHNRRLLITGSVNGVAFEQHLEILGDVLRESDMFYRVACATLKDVKIAQYYAT